MSLLKKLRLCGVFVTLVLALCVMCGAADTATGTILFRTESGVTMTVTDASGSEYTGTHTGTNYLFSLPVGTYTYTATKNEVYHSTDDFTVNAGSNGFYASTITVQAADWLTSLGFRPGPRAAEETAFAMQPEFSASEHSYTVIVPDENGGIAVWQTNSADHSYAHYDTMTESAPPEALRVSLKDNTTAKNGTGLDSALLSGSGCGNTLTVRVDVTMDGVTHYTDYTVNVVRTLSLKDLSVSCGGDAMPFEGGASFAGSVTDYAVTVPAASEELTLNVQTHASNGKYDDSGNGYTVSVNGETVTTQSVSVPLDTNAQTETVTVSVRNEYAPELKTDYTLTVRKAGAVRMQVSLSPQDAVLYLYDVTTGRRVPPQDGVYSLNEGASYGYTLTCKGYVAQSGELTGGETAQLTLSLTAAPENTKLRHDLSSEWADFRGTSYDGTTAGGTAGSNNGAVSVRTPINADEGTLLWASKLGEGADEGGSMGGNALGSPILADGALIVYAGSTLYRVDPDTGLTLAKAPMAASSSYSINSPTYYDGMVFVGLAGGRVQAFNAVTLESLWVYQNENGGQPNCPITVHDGYLYTGFWTGEEKAADFVCLTVTDEDPSQTSEAKTAMWRYTHTGGFYWAGSYACADYVIVGSDDGAAEGTAGASTLYLFDARTGAVLDRIDDCVGDIRSTICYDGQAFSFTTKGGYFYCVPVEQDGDGWQFGELKSLALGGASTSTPVVANGRAYVGVQGAGQFKQYSGHCIAVIDLDKDNPEIAYTVPTQGYPQTSGLLTTAYASKDGCNYVYFIDNYTPGKLRVLRDSKSAPDGRRTLESSVETAYALFTPASQHAAYAICSPIADQYGTLYFKNDSGYLMAFGSTVQELTLTKEPSKMDYVTGDTVNLAGMQVTATLTNGLTRDITKLFTAPERALTAQDAVSRLTLYPADGWGTYHNEPNGKLMTAGVTTAWKPLTIPVRVTELTENGMILTDYVNQTLTLRVNPAQAATVICAQYDGAGRLVETKTVTVQAGAQNVSVRFDTAPAAGGTVRCFLLGGAQTPLCAAVERTVR